jgi:hypothetical protein
VKKPTQVSTIRAALLMRMNASDDAIPTLPVMK